MTDAERIDWLAKHLMWICGSYDGPDYLCNAKNSSWILTSEFSILNVKGNEVTLDLREAIDEAAKQERDTCPFPNLE